MRTIFAAVFAAAAVAASLVGLGCGGHPSPPRSTSPTTPPTGPGTTRCSEGVMGGCVPPAKPGLALPRVTGTLVPDVSEFQTCPLYSEAIFRVYEAGLDREDFHAGCHARELARLGKWAAVYAFLRANRNCTYEAQRVLAIVHSLPVHVQVIIGDAETGIREGKVRCFLTAIEHGGYPAVEYTCPGCGDEQVPPVWIAAYPFRPPGSWVAHQFSSSFNCRGVFGDCSVDEGLLAIHRKPPVDKEALEDRIEAIRRWLVAYGCRRRVKQHEHIGPRCRQHFAEGERRKRELAAAG